LGHSFEEKQEVIKLRYKETSSYSVACKARGDLMSMSHILASQDWLYFTGGETASARAPHSRKFPQLLAGIVGRSQVLFCSCLYWNTEVMNLQLSCLNSHLGGFRALTQCTFGLDKEKQLYRSRERALIWTLGIYGTLLRSVRSVSWRGRNSVQLCPVWSERTSHITQWTSTLFSARGKKLSIQL